MRSVDELDPANPDTDGDGLIDGYEDTNLNGIWDETELDARLTDIDNDGLGDYLESHTATDPTVADSDQDGLKDGVEDRNQNVV